MSLARFPKSRRVRKRREFLAAQRAGLRVSCRHFVVLVARRAEPTGGDAHTGRAAARLGLVASRKVGGAVVRNRGKRLVREWFRLRGAGLPDGIDLLVVLRAGAGALSLDQVEAELDGLLPQIHRRAERALAAPRAAAGPGKTG
jgi:ribonuclease P protein component